MLEIKNISAGYDSTPVLKGLTASFEKGRLTGIIGVNGCGKSTLLKAMLGIIPISSGEITVDGIPLGEMSRNEAAKRISYLAQGRSTPDMTVEQMVLHGRFPYLSYPRRYTDRDRKIAAAAMSKVGIEAYAHRALSSLSGGMRQTAYIAMALAQDTDYILLDEPTTYLDIAHQLELMRLLRALVDSGKGIIAVMHDLPMTFDQSDEVVILHNGCAALQGTPSLLSKSDMIKEIFGVELKLLKESNKYYYL